jgi:hypothetical protein
MLDVRTVLAVAVRTSLCETYPVDLAKKLQVKPGQGVETLNAPATVAGALDSLAKVSDGSERPALLVFVTDRASLHESRSSIVDAASADQLTWVSYPKAGQLGTDLNRDSLAAFLAASGIAPVRQISIDDVWSALRFRPGN